MVCHWAGQNQWYCKCLFSCLEYMFSLFGQKQSGGRSAPLHTWVSKMCLCLYILLRVMCVYAFLALFICHPLHVESIRDGTCWPCDSRRTMSECLLYAKQSGGVCLCVRVCSSVCVRVWARMCVSVCFYTNLAVHNQHGLELSWIKLRSTTTRRMCAWECWCVWAADDKVSKTWM